LGLKDDLRRLKERVREQQGETPWWTLPPGEEPTWPRPLRHRAGEELEELYLSGVDDYIDALEEDHEYRERPEEAYTRQEAFHEYRWRAYGIARRMDLPGVDRPEGWEPPQNNDEERMTKDD
jgi:hypothetical protein